MQTPPDQTPFPRVYDEAQKSRAIFFYRDVCVLKEIEKDANDKRYGKLSIFPKVCSYGKLSLLPTVHAAKAPEAPKRPPPMKFEDLPIYESPHYEYKDYIEDKKRCPRANEKLLQTYLYPSVCQYRKRMIESVGGLTKELCLMQKEVCNEICKNKVKFKNYMRAEENLLLRKGVVALGTLTGVYLGSGTRGVIRKLFGGTLGALAAGALCFPKETDEIFREVSYKVGKIAISIINACCNGNFAMRERIPCQQDLPSPPQPRPADKSNKHCEQKKK
ncbi:unnamed protein product [Arctia plantaginis]|uniref:MICOS complex subunit n=1 Tax=Arctia plantaginis TaxID=874455 RepID=A0A8S1BRU3_ARCPL|nr:unnamed protein product [Arctia plantaginis]